MIGLAGVIYWQGEADGAAQLYEEVLPVLRQLGDEQRLAETLFATSFTAFARGDTATAVARSEEAIGHFRAAGDEASARLVEIQREIGQLFAAPEAVAEGEIGRLFVIGDEKVEEGIALTREAIEITGRLGRAHEQADWLGTLAQLHQNRGDYARALEAFRDTTRVWYAMGNLGMAPYMKVAAAIEVGLGRPERAVRLAAVAQRAIDELGGELHPVLMAAGDPLGDARVMLGDEAYVRALEAGRAMSFDDAVAFLLDEEADASAASAASAS
jgi:hypothetical protein